MGHCNVQTDIKEAVFLGEKDELVACGSDDGRVFIYRADTGAQDRLVSRRKKCLVTGQLQTV
jgi:hypothetical protein